MIDVDKLQHLNEHLSYGGEINIGPLGIVEGAAASDEHNCYAMLARKDGESLTALLVRLDEAIRLAVEEEIFTDEINV